MTAAVRPAAEDGAGEAQIAGFLLEPTTGALKGYRWAPRHATAADPDGRRLHYTPPPLAVPLCDAALRRAAADPDAGLTVHRLADGRCYDLGRFRVCDWDGRVVSLRSCGDAPVAVAPAPHRTTTAPLVPDPVSPADVFAHWRLDAAFDRVAYPVSDPERTVVPDVALYGVAGDDLLAWFGDANRFGRNCLGFLSGLHPTRAMFATARALAVRHRYPVVLVYGDPTPPGAADALETNCALQVIAVQPGSGTTRRAHFAAGADGRVRLCAGERGETG